MHRFQGLDSGLLYSNSYYSDQENGIAIVWSNVHNEDHLNLRIVLIEVQMSARRSQYVNARSWKIFCLPEKSQTRENIKNCFMVVFDKPQKALSCYIKYENQENGI